MSEVKCTHPDLRWVVLGPAERRRYIRVRCSCPAANEKEIDKYDFMKGMNLSCGCLQKERARASQTTHGRSKTRTYRIWAGMRSRCENKRSKVYHNYGGRGITVCERWRESYQNFLDDMGEAPAGHEIDRYPDNDGNYEPGNCRWTTSKENSRNQRKTRNITYDGRTQCISAWEQELGYPRSLINTRLRMGWSVRDAIETPPNPTTKLGGGQQFTYEGRTQNVPAWAKEYGIPENVLRERLRMGWHVGRALMEPVQEKYVLSAEQEIEICRRYDKGSQRNGGPALAKEFGVAYSTIMRIVKAPDWRTGNESTG